MNCDGFRISLVIAHLPNQSLACTSFVVFFSRLICHSFRSNNVDGEWGLHARLLGPRSERNRVVQGRNGAGRVRGLSQGLRGERVDENVVERAPRGAMALFGVVLCCVLFQVGLLVNSVLADTPGNGTPINTTDPDSDKVGATAAEFRVDESGAATYSIPIYAVPGTAGVSPKLALSYSSQGGYGPIGKGWAISGLSSITRCRATREAGDFMSGGNPVDGNPAPVNYSGTDRYCLDGQRLISVVAPATDGWVCPSFSAMTKVSYRTEVESFQRVCGYTPTGGTTGPVFFTVERKDGSISWYGDRDNNSTSNRPDAYFNSTRSDKTGFALAWAQTRFQDSTGNYIDYLYYENADSAVGEQLIKEIRYTGKTVLSGQSGTASTPYAKLQFTYTNLTTAARGIGYSGGGQLTRAHRLSGIYSCATASDCSSMATNQARYYALSYSPTGAPSGSGNDVLASIQECRTNTAGDTCLPATTFTWSAGEYEFGPRVQIPSLATGGIDKFRGFKMGDIDGDGRQDIVFLKNESCPNDAESIYVLYADMPTGDLPSYSISSQVCAPAEEAFSNGPGDGGWQLIDYNGDGRDDLFIRGPSQWHVFLSQGRSGNKNFLMGSDQIAGLSPAIASQTANGDQPQLADINGDGLTDIVYPRNWQLYARIMQRSGSTFAWGPERMVTIPGGIPNNDPRCATGLPPTGYLCFTYISGMVTKTGFTQLADFNGDAASDLLLGVQQDIEDHRNVDPGCQQWLQARGTQQFSSRARIAADEVEAGGDDDGGTGESVVEPGVGVAIPYETQTAEQTESNVVTGCDIPTETSTYSNAYVVTAITPSEVQIALYASVGGSFAAVSLADANGDGLTDLFYQATGGDWNYKINTGTGMQAAVSLPGSYESAARFVDVNGDGRADVLQLIDAGQKEYRVRYALPAGGFGTATTLPGDPTGDNTVFCGSCSTSEVVPIFSDLDGDGNLDYAAIHLNDNADVYLSRANSRFTPRDVITQFTNGLGAQTNISYAPLTNAALYRRDSGSRNGTNWGRGAPVLDLLAPMYAVSKVSSSAPKDGNASALSTLYYRYAGAKVQSGGRGMLGFREIVTYDPNETGGYVSTQTQYAQNFPFVGMPVRTIKRAAIGATYTSSACLNGTITNACFSPVGSYFTDPTGEWFSDSTQDWEGDTDFTGAGTTAFAAGVRAPVHVRTSGTVEKLRDPYTGETTSRVETTFGYGTYGNVASTAVDTYTGTSTLTSSVTTTNSYQGDDPADWHLARLTYSTVAYSRPNRTTTQRVTSFSYDATTGQLLRERLEYNVGPDVDLKRVYVLDDYGNRLQESACSIDVVNCGDNSAVVFRPSLPTTVNRYTRTAYTSNGRYPLATYGLFSDGGATPNGVQEVATQTVSSRDVFGNVTQAYDANGVDSVATYGRLGRPYYAWTETQAGGTAGIASYTLYRNCSDVSCPAGAKFRQEQRADGAPSAWTYFDVLGRPMMKVAETFNIGDSGADLSAVCTTYTATGKAAKVSNPFFLPGGEGSNGPNGVTNACTGAGLLWTSTTYDVLGRPKQVTTPDVNGGTATASIAYSGRATTTTDPRGNTTTKVVDGLGELTSVTDDAGLVTTYWYQADGSNYLVQSDAGRGDVENSFQFDALGRKIQQNDPDSGITQFGYNALGEVIWQQHENDARIENSIDARGRVWQRIVKPPGGAAETTSTFEYDTATNGLGQLASESISGTYSGWTPGTGTNLSFARSYAYDTLGRAAGTTTTLDGANYDTAVAYDGLGRPWKAKDASGQWSKTQYNALGMAMRTCRSTVGDTDPTCYASVLVYEVLETDPWGHVSKERRGNSAAMIVQRDYAPETGRLAYLCAGTVGTNGCAIFDAGYNWDKAGNLITQTFSTGSRYAETYSYDGLNRLTQAKLLMQGGVTQSTVTQAFQYDALGNICRRYGSLLQDAEYTYLGRSGCGLGDAKNSAYGGGSTNAFGAHQSVQIDAGTTGYYGYDASGNQVTKTIAASPSYNRTIKYSLDNHAYEATPGSGTAVKFWYGSDGARYKRVEGSKTTYYLGNVEIEVVSGASTIKRTLAGVYVQTLVGGTTTANNYLFHDQLGNLARITDASGNPVNSMDYAAFGSRRDWSTQGSGGQVPSLTTRGFTGQEHIDGNLGLMHFNARMYDPAQGRFLQPDPVIQSPDNAQSWNPYTYCLNNPYTYTDPTGMMSWRQVLGIVIAVVAVVTQQYWALKGAAAFWFAVGTGFVSGYVATGTLQGGLYGAFSAGVFFGIGQAFSSISGPAGTGAFGTGLNWGEYAAKVLAHGVAGGVMNTLMGGKFGDGFLSAGVAQAFGPAIDRIPGGAGVRVAAAAVLGGTVSKLSGGKFANGAITAAFSRAFNEGFHREAQIRARNAVVDRVDEFRAKNPGALIPLSSKDIGVLADYYMHEVDYYQSVDGDYSEMRAVKYWDLMSGPRGDAFNFYNWGSPGGGAIGEVFNVSGMPGPYSGIQNSNDMNYMMQGMSAAARGEPLANLHAAIAVWNSGQAAQDLLGGSFTFRNIYQISHATMWADFGYSYYKEHGN